MVLDEEIDRTKLRYVRYARRSTTDEGSQVRSVPDQIKYCIRHAEIAGLNIVATRDRRSARQIHRTFYASWCDGLRTTEKTA